MYLILVLKYYWMYKKKSMHFARVFFKYSMQDNFVKLFPNLVLMKVLMALTLKLISSIEMFHHTSWKDTSFFEKRYLRRSPYWLICIWVMEYDWVYKKESHWRFFWNRWRSIIDFFWVFAQWNFVVSISDPAPKVEGYQQKRLITANWINYYPDMSYEILLDL